MENASPFNATLLKRIDINDSLARFLVKFKEDQVPDFQPGQYTTLGLLADDQPDPDSPRAKRGPKLIRRAYSIASPPTEKGHIEFYIVRVDDGRFTPKLWQVEEGGEIFMDNRIKGKFTLEDVEPGKNLLMVGTGTGLAPFRSMLMNYRGTGLWKNIVIIEGCRQACDLGYYDELTQLTKEEPTLRYLPSVTREPEDSPWQGLRGRIHSIMDPQRFEELAGFPLESESCQVFLCGSPQMIEDAQNNLGKLGFVTRDRENPHGNIHFEKYW